MPKGLRQVALSISRLSPIVRWPDALLATKMASLIFLPERRFFAFTSFQSLSWPSLSFGSSSTKGGFHGACQISHVRYRWLQDFLSRGGFSRSAEAAAVARLPDRGPHVS